MLIIMEGSYRNPHIHYSGYCPSVILNRAWSTTKGAEKPTCEEAPYPGVIVDHIRTTPSHCRWTKEGDKPRCCPFKNQVKI